MNRHPYVDLWFLLTISLLVLLAIAFHDTHIQIGSYTVKHAPFRETLFRMNEVDGSSVEPMMPAVPAEVEESEREPMVVDQSPQTILIFGDSMIPNLARRLAAYAGENGHNAVHSVNWDSSTTITWADSDRIEEFIGKYNPTFIFVCLGSNECYMRNPEQRIPTVKRIIAKFGNIPYVWIGPPWFKKQGSYNDMLAKLLGEKHFFRSDGLDLQRGEDNIHPVQSASNCWMDSIMRWLPNSAHPFLSEPPSANTKRAKLTFDSFGPSRKINKEADTTATPNNSDTMITPKQEVPENEAPAANPEEPISLPTELPNQE